MSFLILQGDARYIPLADESVQCVVTSPPYWGLRDYGLEPLVWRGEEGCGHKWCDEDVQVVRGKGGNWQAVFGGATGKNRFKGDIDVARQPEEVATIQRGFCLRCTAWRGSLGLEPTPELYVQHIVEIFREVKRVLRKDGTCWVNMGDNYTSGDFTRQGKPRNVPQLPNDWAGTELGGRGRANHSQAVKRELGTLKPKDLLGMPWRVAFALQADGWWLRSDIIWAKTNPMPESVTDRPTKAHEYLFLLTKSEKYYWDQEAVREGSQANEETIKRAAYGRYDVGDGKAKRNFREGKPDYLQATCNDYGGSSRNIRTVWTIATQPFPEAHFATFPEKLVEPCVLAGSKEGDLAIDPFAGSGTVGVVCSRLNRRFVGIELSEEYCKMAVKRIEEDAPLFNRRCP